MDDAWIRGSVVARDAAVGEAARILSESHMPVIAGMATDAAGAEEAVALARRIGAAIDHEAGAALIGLRDAMVGAAAMLTTPPEARARADLLLLVGSGLEEAWPDIWEQLRPERAPALHPDRARHVIRLCPGDDKRPPGIARTIDGDATTLRADLAMLCALLRGHRVAPGGASAELESCVAALRNAHYAVVVWSPARLDPLATELLLGLIDACNATTRCAGLPLALAGNADGVAQACAWSAGFPTRFGVVGDAVLHDPWRLDAARLVASGEADAVVWIADHAPPWPPGPPSIVLAGVELDFTPHVQIAVGVPGRDHAALLHAPELGVLAHRGVARPTGAATVAAVLREIAARIDPC